MPENEFDTIPEPKLHETGTIHVFKRTVIKAQKVNAKTLGFDQAKKMEAKQIKTFKAKKAR